jgi:hypothetical protein
MNRIEHGGEAVVEYLDANLRLVKPGSYVRCAVTGDRIPSISSSTGASICRRPTPGRRRR